MVKSTDPVSAWEGRRVGLIDEVVSRSSVGFVESVMMRAEKLARGGTVRAEDRGEAAPAPGSPKPAPAASPRRAGSDESVFCVGRYQ
uniref:Uncharacterized protein n=1 Tax=Physcomitrium patens TaxID=3218 RepID=A0A7I3ZT09_PHYPA